MKRRLIKNITAVSIAAAMVIAAAGIPASARTLELRGDIDRDGKVTANDAVETLRISTGSIEAPQDNVARSRTDVDGDGEITANDALLMLRESVGFNAIVQSSNPDAPYTVNDGVNDFSAEIFKRCYGEGGENTLVSPLSVYTALAMLTNGARGQTQSELLDMLGGGTNTTADINSYLNGYISNINNGNILRTANSLFVMKRDDIEMDQGFIDEIQKDYFAEIFHEPANDETVDKINSWVDENTQGMIKELASKGSLTPDLVSIILNAVSFKAKWSEQYDEWDIRKGTFHNYNGTSIETDFLHGTESYYISDGKATGFIKPYRGDTWLPEERRYKESYGFVAILPNEGITIDEYIAQMNDATIKELVNTRTFTQTITVMPKFKFECTYGMNEMLKDMGMISAFGDADLSGLARSKVGNNIFVSSVIHKTYISLDESGTDAAAVTSISEVDSAMPEPEKKIVLDRPYIFVIYDMNNNMPVFIGTVCNF